MVDMAKLKEEALQRKREHDAKQREAQRRKEHRRRPPARQTRSANRRSASPGADPRATRPVRQTARKPRSGRRWLLDAMLVLGALLILVILFNPYA